MKDMPDYVEMVDYFGNRGKIDLKIKHYEFGSKKILIYARSYLVNETNLDFFYFGSNQPQPQHQAEQNHSYSYSFVPGQRKQVNQHIQSIYEQEFANEQKKITLFSNQQNLKISLSEDPKYYSSPLFIGGIGYDILYLTDPSDDKYQSCSEFTANV